MRQSRKRSLLWWLLANFCRLLLAATFVFSGMVKLIDPRGTQYKIEDYTAYLDLSAFLPQGTSLFLAVLLALFEFYVGLSLFFGIRRRTTTRMTLLFMVVMTPLTLYLAWTDAHMDCGCFGDVVVLTNWQTFGKNLVLLVAAMMVTYSYRRLTRFITERNQWLLLLYSMVFALFLSIYTIRHLPIMDFRPYQVGVDLPKVIKEEWEGDGTEMRYADFSIQTLTGEDITLPWLEQEGYKFLLVAPFLELADDGQMDYINGVYDYCQQFGYPFLALTSSLEESIEYWKDLTGAEYEFAHADGTVLKTIVRSNPGLLLMHDGMIYQKWSAEDIPELGVQSAPLEELRIGKMQEKRRVRTVSRLFLFFMLPLLAWTLIDRIWIASKYYKRYRIHKSINFLNT